MASSLRRPCHPQQAALSGTEPTADAVRASTPCRWRLRPQPVPQRLLLHSISFAGGSAAPAFPPTAEAASLASRMSASWQACWPVSPSAALFSTPPPLASGAVAVQGHCWKGLLTIARQLAGTTRELSNHWAPLRNPACGVLHVDSGAVVPLQQSGRSGLIPCMHCVSRDTKAVASSGTITCVSRQATLHHWRPLGLHAPLIVRVIGWGERRGHSMAADFGGPLMTHPNILSHPQCRESVRESASPSGATYTLHARLVSEVFLLKGRVPSPSRRSRSECHTSAPHCTPLPPV